MFTDFDSSLKKTYTHLDLDTCQRMPTPKKGRGELRWEKSLFYYYR